MWLFTVFGFFSIIADRENKGDEKDVLSVRARVKKDLERLKTKYLAKASTSEIVALANRDYPYRMYVWKSDIQRAMPDIVGDITYHNFKDEVTKQDSKERHDIYSEVWSVMYNAEEKLKDRKRRNDAWAKSFSKGHQTSLFRDSSRSSGKSYTVGKGGRVISIDTYGKRRDPALEDPFYVNENGITPHVSDDGPADSIVDNPRRTGTAKRTECPWCDRGINVEKFFTKWGEVRERYHFKCPNCKSPVITEKVEAVKTNKGRIRSTKITLGMYFEPLDVPEEDDPTITTAGPDQTPPTFDPPFDPEAKDGEVTQGLLPDDLQKDAQDAQDAQDEHERVVLGAVGQPDPPTSQAGSQGPQGLAVK